MTTHDNVHPERPGHGSSTPSRTIHDLVLADAEGVHAAVEAAIASGAAPDWVAVHERLVALAAHVGMTMPLPLPLREVPPAEACRGHVMGVWAAAALVEGARGSVPADVSDRLLALASNLLGTAIDALETVAANHEAAAEERERR